MNIPTSSSCSAYFNTYSVFRITLTKQMHTRIYTLCFPVSNHTYSRLFCPTDKYNTRYARENCVGYITDNKTEVQVWVRMDAEAVPLFGTFHLIQIRMYCYLEIIRWPCSRAAITVQVCRESRRRRVGTVARWKKGKRCCSQLTTRPPLPVAN